MKEWLFYNAQWLSICIYIVPPLLSLTLLYLYTRKRVWLAIPITALCDLLFWGVALDSSHGIALSALFLMPQLLAVSIATLCISRKDREKKR